MKNLTKTLCLLLSLVLCLSLFAGCSSQNADEPSAEPTELPDITEPAASEDIATPAAPLEEPPLMGLAYGSNTATALSGYSIMEALPKDASMSAVVAVDGENNPILTNAQLQFFFWEEVYQMQQQYGEYYLSMMGLDMGTSLSQQASLMEEHTWEQYFLESMKNTFSNFYAWACAAKAENFQLPPDDVENLDYYTSTDGAFVEEIKGAGYEGLEDYLNSFYGAGVDMEDYRAYLENYMLAMAYYNDVLYVPVADALTEAEIEAYFDENAEDMAARGLQKVNNVSVRHILIQPEGEADAETGEFTEAQWAAAETEAQRIYDLWLENPTEDYFAELANEHSTDGGSNTTGGIYENFTPGQMVAEFNDWSFDQSRQTGDHGIVKTTYGYHIMYFVEQTETRVWYDTVKDTMANEAAVAVLESLKEQYPAVFDFTQVRIYDILAVAAQAQPQNEEEHVHEEGEEDHEH